MILYWRNPSDWGLSPLTDASLRVQQNKEEKATEFLASLSIANFTGADVNFYVEIFNTNKKTAEQIIRIQSTSPCDRSTEDWLFLRSVFYSALAQHDRESDFVEKQLILHAASYTLVRAVRKGDDTLISLELFKVSNLEKRCVLKHIIQRLGPLLGKQR